MAVVSVDVSDDATRMQRGFVALALCGDNSVRASEQCGVPDATLRRWRREHRHEYDRVRRELAPRLESIVVAEQYAFIIEAGHAKRLALAKTMDALENDQIPARDLPGALRNITTAEAISIDKVLALSGRPTSIVEHRSAAELVRKLAAMGAVVDGTAAEIPAESSG